MKNEGDCEGAGIEAATSQSSEGTATDGPDDACDAYAQSSDYDNGSSIVGDYSDDDGIGEGAQKFPPETEHIISDECESNETQGNETATVTTMTSGAETTDTDTIMATVPDASHASIVDKRSDTSAAISSNEDEDTSLDVTGSLNNNYGHLDEESSRPPPTTSVETPEERLQRKISSMGDDASNNVGTCTGHKSTSSVLSVGIGSARATSTSSKMQIRTTQSNSLSGSSDGELVKPTSGIVGGASQEDTAHDLDSDAQTNSVGDGTNSDLRPDGPSSLHSRLVGTLQHASPPASATDPPSRDISDEDAQLDIGGTMITSTANLYANGIFTRPGAYRIDPLPPSDSAGSNNGRGDNTNAVDDGVSNNSSGAAPSPTRLRRSTNNLDEPNVSHALTASTSHHGSSTRSGELRPAEIHDDDNDHAGQAPVAVPVGASAPIEASLVVDPLHIVSVHDDGNGWKGQRRQKRKRIVALSVVCVAIVGIVLGVVLGNKRPNDVGDSNIDTQMTGSAHDQRPSLPILDWYQMIPLPSPPVPTNEMNGRCFQQSIVKISAQGKRVIVASPQVSLGLKESSDFVGTTPTGSNGVVQVYDAVFEKTASSGGREIDEETALPLRKENNQGLKSVKIPNDDNRNGSGNGKETDDRGNAQSISEYREQYRFTGQPIGGGVSSEAQTVPTQFGDVADGIVGHALDFDDSGNVVAISFMQRFTNNHRLGSGPNPGLVRVFARNITDNSWRQLGDDITASGIHRFGTSVGVSVSPMSGGRLIVGSEDGTARAYRRVGDLSTTGSWERVDNVLLDFEGGRGSKVSVAMTTIGRRFVVGHPDSGVVRMFQFDDDNPNGPNIRQVGPDLRGDVSDDGFGHSVSINLRGEFLVVGSRSGRYVQSFILPIRMEEALATSTTESWQRLPAIHSELIDKNGFGYSVSAGRANPRHTGPVKGRPYTPDGQRIIVGSPEFGDGRGRAVVYQFNATDVTWYRFSKQAVGRDKFSRLGHSVSLSAQSMFVAASSGVGIASSQGEVQLFKLDETE